MNSDIAFACPDKTRDDLEWPRLLAAVRDRCEVAAAKRLATSLPFVAVGEVRANLEESKEATVLLNDGDELPALFADDVDDALKRVSAGGALAPEELRNVSSFLASARLLRRYLSTREVRAPRLHHSCATDPTLDPLADEIAQVFDIDGTLKDNASPELKRLREEQRASRARMLSRLDEIMNKYGVALQDRFVTEREGRFVLPVKSDSHERFPGIVHASSASGATIFVEPRVVIPLGNRLKMLDAEVAREEAAICAQLSALLCEKAPSLLDARDRLARADVKRAIARLARDIKLVFPNLSPEPLVDARSLRHPLLLLEIPNVISSDLRVDGKHALVVSGPNAGGKTVALKAMGLAALMIRAGMPIACDEGSSIGIFERVLTDVGDDQSLSRSLSTFSAHVKNLSEILDECSEGTLVLLDELAGGTDPREGEALAIAVLDSMTARGATVVATTHYEGLKMMAVVDPRFLNASVALDSATMAPSFRVTLGVPGASSALLVAQRFGLSPTIVERAKKYLSRDDIAFDELTRRMNDERAALEVAKDAVVRREQELSEKKEQLEQEIAAYKDREHRQVSREAEALLQLIRRSKDEVRTAEARLRKRHIDTKELKDAAKMIDRVAGTMAIGGALEHLVRKDDGSEVPNEVPTELKVGMRVYVPRLRAKAEIISIDSDGSARVAAGPLKIRVTREDLRKAIEEEVAHKDARGPKGQKAANRAPPVNREEPAISTKDNTCDLRGLDVEDALSMAMTFLDRALHERMGIVFLLHGHGTGALKDAIRRELKTTSVVAHSRPATSEEGGDGMTVVWLA